VKGRGKFLQKEAPAQDTLCLQVGECNILVVSVNMEFTTTKQHVAILTKSFNDAEEFFFTSGVVALSGIEFPGVECHGGTILHNNRPKLEVRSIGVNMEWFVMIGITDEGIFGKHGFDGLESLVTLRCPCEIPFSNLSS
jgi:hypothetical protein